MVPQWLIGRGQREPESGTCRTSESPRTAESVGRVRPCHAARRTPYADGLPRKTALDPPSCISPFHQVVIGFNHTSSSYQAARATRLPLLHTYTCTYCTPTPSTCTPCPTPLHPCPAPARSAVTMPVPVTPPTLHIPAIDLSPSSSQTDSERASILLSALATVGFLHVLNPSPSLTRSHVCDIFAAGSTLFDTPLSDKEAVGFDVATGAGYTSMMGQTTGDKSKRLRGDLKESFSIGPNTAVSIPQSSVHSDPTIVNRLEEFREACFETGLRLLDLFTTALKTPDDDPAYFRSKHSYGNNESLRLIHYPAFPRASADEEGAQTKATGWEDLRIGDKDIRAGAHQDFGSA